MKNKIYIAMYSKGRYEDETEHIVFASTNKSKVSKWCTKFNKMIIKLSDYYKKYEDDFGWIKVEYMTKHYKRWSWLRNINNAYYEETKIR